MAHELTHVIQINSFQDEDFDAAEALGEVTKRVSATSAEYARYVRHPVELPAHGAMDAADMIVTQIHDPAMTWSYGYIWNRLGDDEDAGRILELIYDEAMLAYGALTNPT